MGFKEWIVPQDRVFFSLLEKESNIVMEAASLLLELVKNPVGFEENDVKEILIMKDIYEQLEEIADKCQDVALVIQDLVIKNA
ncbi:hypothetical protein MUP05_07135 [Candidatus Bathyarchaeota archaeon]|nr:hypothetical protein [Candidatus Bathyarchaeota archaeon]